MPRRLILASGSPQRKLILSTLNVPFEIIPAQIDEKAIRHADLGTQSQMIARAKAETVAAQHTGVIVAADTFIELNGQALEKPVDRAEAEEMLRNQSGKTINVHTGYCYLDREKDIDYSTNVLIVAKFRELSESEIQLHVGTLPVTTWSGAFSAAYPLSATVLSEINGSFSGIVYGLPMEHLIPLLEKSGFDIHP